MDKKTLDKIKRMMLCEQLCPGIRDEIIQIMVLGGKAIRDVKINKKLNRMAEDVFKMFLKEHLFSDYFVSIALEDTKTEFLSEGRSSELQGYMYYFEVMLRLLGYNDFLNGKYIYEMDEFSTEAWKRNGLIDYLNL